MGRNVDSLARAIAIAEGYIDRSDNVLNQAPARRNNPGSLRASSFASKTVNGYAVFSTALDGWKGLYRQIALDRDRGLTLQEFIFKYAPPSENRSAEYLALVERETGLPRTARLSEVLEAYPANNPALPAFLPGVLTNTGPAPVRDTLPSFGRAKLPDILPDLGRHKVEIIIGLAGAGLVLMVWGGK